MFQLVLKYEIKQFNQLEKENFYELQNTYQTIDCLIT